jgi:hypothetical protein
VRRALLRSCAWEGLWTGTANTGSLHEDLDIDDAHVGVYMEHFTTLSIFQRMRIGSRVKLGVNCEWVDPAWGGRPGSVDNFIQDSTISSWRAGIDMDQGTTRTTARRIKFVGQSLAAIVDFMGVGNSYTDNDYSGILPSAVPIYYSHYLE